MGIFRKIGEKLVGKEGTIIWERNESPDNPQRGLVYRIPNSTHPDMRRVEQFGVRDYERALLYKSGQLMSVVEGGLYELEKDHRNSATEIVWVDIGIVELPWGIPHFQSMIMTTEMIKVGMNGSLKMRVADASAFIQKVVSFQKDFTDKVAKDFVTSLFITSLRDVIKNYTLTNLVRSNREDIKALTRTKLSEEFKLYGLELISNDIIGFAFPPEVQSQVDEILGETLDDLGNLREEKTRLEDAIKSMKLQLEDLENKYASGDIDDEEFDNKEQRIKKILSRRQDELNSIQGKMDNITKNKGIRN